MAFAGRVGPITNVTTKEGDKNQFPRTIEFDDYNGRMATYFLLGRAFSNCSHITSYDCTIVVHRGLSVNI